MSKTIPEIFESWRKENNELRNSFSFEKEDCFSTSISDAIGSKEFGDYIPKKGHKTGYILFFDNLSFSFKDAQSETFWKSMVELGVAKFYTSAFCVNTSETENLRFSEVTFKRRLEANKFKKVSIIEVFETGGLLMKIRGEDDFCGLDCDLYEVFPYEPDTQTIKGQTRVIYRVKKDTENEAFILGLDFNPNKISLP